MQPSTKTLELARPASGTETKRALRRRDIVVIGASAGGVEALEHLVAGLPAGFPAALFIVLHVEAGRASLLPDLLNKRGPLPVRHAIHGDLVKRGQIVVAPPDNHLLLSRGYVRVVRGPKENGHRPAVDALFRSASAAYGSRVIGALLTGYRDCGTVGLLSIKAHGGLAVVQDPADAVASEMPANAIRYAPVDHVVPIREMPALLVRLVQEPAVISAVRPPAAVRALEGEEPGAPADIVCPVCNGRMQEAEMHGFTQYRCHVGHLFSLDSVVAEQAEEVERALWAAVRALEEGAALARRLASRTTGDLKATFEERVSSQTRQADIIRQLLISGHGLSRLDADKAAKV